MATVIRAIDSKFTHPSIDGVEDINYEGLVYAIRPSMNENGLKDLSGNGNLPSIRGELLYDSQSVICGKLRQGITKELTSGFTVPVPETRSFTWFNTFKIITNQEAIDKGLGEEDTQIGMNTFSHKISGCSMYGTYFDSGVNIRPQWYDDEAANQYKEVSGTNGLDNDYWISACMVMDATNDLVDFYYLRNGEVHKVEIRNNRGTRVPPLQITERLISPDNPLSFGTVSDPVRVETFNGFRGMYHCAEALAYNRALAESEVVEQLQKTRLAMKKKGIHV